MEGGQTKEGEEGKRKGGGRKKGGRRKLRINFTAKDCFGMYGLSTCRMCYMWVVTH